MNSDVEKTLPEGWKYVQLGDLSEYINGYTFKSKDWSNKGLPIIRIQNLNGKDEYNYFESEIKEKYKVFNGDILISWSASLDVYYWQGGDAVLNQHIFNTKINTEIITKEFFYHTIKYSLAEISRNLHGMGLKHITKGKFERILSPLPPLEEQKRIVTKIDTLFAKIDKAITLTEESLVQAKNLLPSVLKEVFENGKADGWEEKKLEDVCEKITDGSHNPPKSCEGSNLMMLSGRNVRDNKLDFEKVRFVSENDFIREDKRTSIKVGDVLLTIVGSIGRSFVFPEGVPRVIFQRSVAVIKPYSILNPYFLSYYLKSPKIQEELNTEARGAAQKGIYLKDIRAFLLLFPNLDIQSEKVLFLDKVSSQSKKAQSKLEEQLAYLKQLKSSILSKAFKGEL